MRAIVGGMSSWTSIAAFSWPWNRRAVAAVLPEFLRAATLALLAFFPFGLAAVDHHALERIPTHGHLGVARPLVPDHVHGFEVAHSHDSAMESETEGVRPAGFLPGLSITEPARPAAAALSVVVEAAVLAFLGFSLATRSGSTRFVPTLCLKGLCASPPTPPPR